ncbi:DUF5994 family protein [Streptomyces diastatochromogenes]|nr:DUF5994 family protein [Streptomyces diastatochromogenes]
MADTGIPHMPSRLLPDEVHRAVGPGTALLRLETTGSRQSLLDGAWWPRSRDVEREIPPLITALTEHLGPITRVGLDASAWNDIPTRLTVDDRVVHLDSFPVGDDTVLITRGDNDHFSLMVVPPATTPEAARTAMARAVHADNVTQAAEILLAELPTPQPRRAVLPGRRRSPRSLTWGFVQERMTGIEPAL